MNIVESFFNLFRPTSPAAEQLEDEYEKRVEYLLCAMENLSHKNFVFVFPEEIYDELKQQGHGMRVKDMNDLIAECVNRGFMQKIGETMHQYVLSPNGRNYLGLSGDR